MASMAGNPFFSGVEAMLQQHAANTYAGFNAQELSQYFGNMPVETAQALINWQNGNQLTDPQRHALQQLGPAQLAQETGNGPSGNVLWGLGHLSRHPKGSRYGGDFNVKNFTSDLLTAGTAGIFDFNNFEGAPKVNMPFSGKQIRTGGEASLNALTGEQLKGPVHDLTQNDFAHMITPYVGAAGAALTGYGVAGAFGAAGSTGAMLGAGAHQLGNQIYGALNRPSGPGAPPEAGAAPGGGGLTPQQLASLSAMNSQAHRGLAPSFEARMKGQSPGAGIAGEAFSQFNQM